MQLPKFDRDGMVGQGSIAESVRDLSKAATTSCVTMQESVTVITRLDCPLSAIIVLIKEANMTSRIVNPSDVPSPSVLDNPTGLLERVLKNPDVGTVLSGLRVGDFLSPIAEINKQLRSKGLRVEVEEVVLSVKELSDTTQPVKTRECGLRCQLPPPNGDGKCHYVCT